MWGFPHYNGSLFTPAFLYPKNDVFGHRKEEKQEKRAKLARLDFLWEGLFMFRIYTFIHDFCLSFCLAWRNKWAFQTMLTIFLWSNAWFSCIDGVAGIMPIITCPSCNLTNTRFCREKGFVENTRFCRKTGFVANTRLFGFVWCRLLRRHLGFDSDFAQISGLKIGGWQHCMGVLWGN